jgi:hypothetical protein
MNLPGARKQDLRVVYEYGRVTVFDVNQPLAMMGSFNVPPDGDLEHATATLSGPVLSVVIPKNPNLQIKMIPVK